MGNLLLINTVEKEINFGANIPNLTKNDLSELNFTEKSLLHINTDGGRFYSEFNYTEIF